MPVAAQEPEVFVHRLLVCAPLLPQSPMRVNLTQVPRLVRIHP